MKNYSFRKGVINMTKKIKKSQVLRHVVQFIMFLILPGLYAMTFSEVKIVYQMIIGGSFNFLEAFPSLVEFVAVMILKILRGRCFCGCLFFLHWLLIFITT